MLLVLHLLQTLSLHMCLLDFPFFADINLRLLARSVVLETFHMFPGLECF